MPVSCKTFRWFLHRSILIRLQKRRQKDCHRRAIPRGAEELRAERNPGTVCMDRAQGTQRGLMTPWLHFFRTKREQPSRLQSNNQSISEDLHRGRFAVHCHLRIPGEGTTAARSRASWKPTDRALTVLSLPEKFSISIHSPLCRNSGRRV